jgi:TonB family protein
MFQSLFCLILIGAALFGSAGVCAGQIQERLPHVAVLDFGDSLVGRSVADTFVERLKSIGGIRPVDRDASRIAARGAGYSGSLNLSLKEARDLGEAIGCDFYFIGEAQTVRRSSSTRPVYFESYASIFLVSSRTGKLVIWRRPSFEADDAKTAEHSLLESLSDAFSLSLLKAIQTTYSEEKQQRLLSTDNTIPVIEEAPEDEKAAEAIGLKLPKPYRRLRPAYPASAAQADAEAVVDVLVELDSAGEVNRIDIARWAGFGLDEATIDTVRQLHFFPAMRNGTAVPIRVLLRYNFRKNAK